MKTYFVLFSISILCLMVSCQTPGIRSVIDEQNESLLISRCVQYLHDTTLLRRDLLRGTAFYYYKLQHSTTRDSQAVYKELDEAMEYIDSFIRFSYNVNNIHFMNFRYSDADKEMRERNPKANWDDRYIYTVSLYIGFHNTNNQFLCFTYRRHPEEDIWRLSDILPYYNVEIFAPTDKEHMHICVPPPDVPEP